MGHNMKITINLWPIVFLWTVGWGAAAVIKQSVDLMLIAMLPFLGMAVIFSLGLFFMIAAIFGLFFAWLAGKPVEIERNGKTKVYRRGKRNAQGQ